MAQPKINIWWALVILVAAILLVQYSGLFSIYLQSSQVQYLNKPLEAKFQLGNYTSPQITVFFNDKQLFLASDYYNSTEIIPVEYVNETTNETYTVNESHQIKIYPATQNNQKEIYTFNYINGTYALRLENVTDTGYFKFTVNEGNKTESQTIEVRNPFVDMKNDFELTVKQGVLYDLEIKTYNPQGEVLEADSLEVDLTTPDSSVQSLTFTKSNSTFTLPYTYSQNGNYIYKIRPMKLGYDTKEFTVIVSSTKTGGIHPIIYVVAVAVGIFLLLFGIKLFRRIR